MSLSDLSQDDLNQWAEHPVTVALRNARYRVHQAQVQMACSAYWQGKPWPEESRLALHKMEDLLDDVFHPDLEMTLQTMEKIDEYFRDNPDGVQRPDPA